MKTIGSYDTYSVQAFDAQYVHCLLVHCMFHMKPTGFIISFRLKKTIAINSSHNQEYAKITARVETYLFVLWFCL